MRTSTPHASHQAMQLRRKGRMTSISWDSMLILVSVLVFIVGRGVFFGWTLSDIIRHARLKAARPRCALMRRIIFAILP